MALVKNVLAQPIISAQLVTLATTSTLLLILMELVLFVPAQGSSDRAQLVLTVILIANIAQEPRQIHARLATLANTYTLRIIAV